MPDNKFNKGVAYIYEKGLFDASRAETKLMAGNGSYFHEYGAAVSIFGDVVLIGHVTRISRVLIVAHQPSCINEIQKLGVGKKLQY
jgi:hypothetical protein